MTPESLIKRSICEFLDTFPKSHLMFWVQSAGKIPGRINNSKYQRNGIPDICAVYCGEAVFFEVKDIKGKQSDVQKEFEYDCNKAGGSYFVVRSIEDVMAAFDYLNLKPSAR